MDIFVKDLHVGQRFAFTDTVCEVVSIRTERHLTDIGYIVPATPDLGGWHVIVAPLATCRLVD